MSQFAREHPEDWEERLEQMADHADDRCPECDGPYGHHDPSARCSYDPAYQRHVDAEIDRRLGK